MNDAALLRERIGRIFTLAPFVGDLGIEFIDAGPGWCETALAVAPRHLQHGGVAHAGVISTLADHTAGAAAQTQCGEGEMVVTAEFKINLLRPGTGDRFDCRAQVLKAGRALHVVEAEVFGRRGAERILVAKFNGTMAVVRV
ncbi:MAG: PaaI family thioesterase [Proteobacteria bacterium]|nr:PaaI family thioesterase [Pseudomonadota bacterium]